MHFNFGTLAILIALGIVSVVTISLSDIWAFRAMAVVVMGGLLTLTVQSYVRDHMGKRRVNMPE